MRGAGRGRRRQNDTFVPRNPPPPIKPVFSSRESDGSFCSSRPSSPSVSGSRTAIPISDRSYQVAAVRTINNYLSSHSLPFSLKSSLPSAKDITETLRFVLSRLDFPSSRPEDDLHFILKHLNCPIKLNKSALRAPGTPHSWPSLLAVIHWLVQIAMYNDHLLCSSTSGTPFEGDILFPYAMDSYLHYIRGDDETVNSLDHKISGQLEQQKVSVFENVKEWERQAGELQEKLEDLRSGPSPQEVMEKERAVLEDDVKKFHAVIDQFLSNVAAMEKVLAEKDKELKVKEEERREICKENEELKKSVEEQKVNLRDAERMMRELLALRRDAEEVEGARNAWEEKTRDLESLLRNKLKELEELSIECNQTVKRLKLVKGSQHALNPKGSTPVEVLGIDYKLALKPEIESLSNVIKTSSMAKLDDMISLQQQSAELAAKIKSKKNHNTTLCSRIDEVEAEMDILKKETVDYISRHEMEARKMIENVEIESRNLDAVESEVAESLQVSEMKKREAIKQNEEDVERCYKELFGLVDSVSKHKEYTGTKISEMERCLSETAGVIADAYRNSLQLPADIDLDAIP